jgi:4-hydroxy-3-polyprenylbenzoate decarboxylase
LELRLPDGFSNPRIVSPGILAVDSPSCHSEFDREQLARFAASIDDASPLNQFPLVTLVDDADFTSARFGNWLWVVFTRSNPAIDIDGVGASTFQKHWGCRGSLVIDARIKPHHAPPLVEDPETNAKVDARATRGDALAKYL